MMPYLAPFPRYNLRHVQHRYIWLPILRLTPTEVSPWDDLRKILRGSYRMAKVQNGVETLLKNFNRLRIVHVHERYREKTTGRQTDLRYHIPERNVVTFW